MVKRAVASLWACTFTLLPLLSQNFHTPSYTVESGVVVSSGKHAPFWFYSNQYGKISTKNNSLYLLPSIYRNFKDSSVFDYSYNLSPLIRYDGLGRSYVHQWYGELKFHFLHFTAGAKEEFFGNQDSSLSSGCIIWSKNARPMPKLTFYVPNYTPVPFTWRYLEFKGGISHGWFDDNEFNKNVWLHHKYFYLRLGGKFPVHISYGLQHFAQWGGELILDTIKYNLPKNLRAFKKIFFGQSGDIKNSNTPWSEISNKIGNHLGSKQFDLEIKFKNYELTMYWQTIFEDGSGKSMRNIKDGLWGITLYHNRGLFFKQFLFEFINTTNQSGPSDDPTPAFPLGGGNDNYFNHNIYKHGWTYYKATLGTPFINSLDGIKKSNEYINNNKIKSFNVGTKFIIKSVCISFSSSYTLNYGTNNNPINKNIIKSFLIIPSYFWVNKKIYLSSTIGYDINYSQHCNLGLYIKIIKVH